LGQHLLGHGAGVRGWVSLMRLTPAILDMLGLHGSLQFQHFRMKIPTPSGEQLIGARAAASCQLSRDL